MFDHPSFDHERAVFAHDAYVTAGDIGGSLADVEIVAGQMRYVGGLPRLHAAEIHRIPVRLEEIFARSSAPRRFTSELANDMARQLLAEAR